MGRAGLARLYRQPKTADEQGRHENRPEHNAHRPLMSRFPASRDFQLGQRLTRAIAVASSNLGRQALSSWTGASDR